MTRWASAARHRPSGTEFLRIEPCREKMCPSWHPHFIIVPACNCLSLVPNESPRVTTQASGSISLSFGVAPARGEALQQCQQLELALPS